jgi:Flp pilus assembly protein CpaB
MHTTLSTTPGSFAAPKADRRALIIALALGALAALFTLLYLRGVAARTETAGANLTVVVAARDIPIGEKITDGMVELRTLPEAALVSGAATAKEAVVGMSLRYPIAKGEQFSGARLLDPSKVPALSFQIPHGLRGYTIPVDANKSPASLLTPGDFVDVLAAVPTEVLGIAPPAAAQQRATTEFHVATTLLQNVQVISVQRDFAEGAGVYEPATRAAPRKDAPSVQYVTLAVKPDDTQLLALAVDKAKLLTLSLRAFGDSEVPDLKPLPEWQLQRS